MIRIGYTPYIPLVLDWNGHLRIAKCSGKFPNGTIKYYEPRNGDNYVDLENDGTEFFFLPPTTCSGDRPPNFAEQPIKVHASYHISPSYASCPTLTRDSSGAYTSTLSGYTADHLWTPYEVQGSAVHYKEILGLNVSASSGSTSERIIDLSASPSANRIGWVQEGAVSWFLIQKVGSGTISFENYPIWYLIDCSYLDGNTEVFGYNPAMQTASITQHDADATYYLVHTTSLAPLVQNWPRFEDHPDLLRKLTHIKQPSLSIQLGKGLSVRLVSWGMALWPEIFN
jgi:hypothetical protein